MSRRKKRKYNVLKIMVLIIFVGFVVVIAYNGVKNSASTEEPKIEEVTQNKTEEESDDTGNEVVIVDKEISEENKAVENNQKNDIDKEDNNQVDQNVYKTVLAGQSLSFEYPSAWQTNTLEEENKFSFGPKGKVVAAEYQGDIIIVYKENETKKPIERYYDGLNDINLFEDAAGGFEKEEESSYTFYTFKDVVGYTSSTIGVFVLNDSFVEMTDVYNKHQDNGVFKQLRQSFKVE